MGFLSRAAESTFSKTRRRAYVPEWFRPFSYVAAGAAVAGLVLMGVFGDNSLDVTTSEVTAAELVTAGPSSQGSPDPAPVQPSASGQPTGAPSAAAGTVSLPAPSGDLVQVPQQAVDVATKAAAALFTGNFTGVPLAPGQVPPTVSSPWPKAAAGAPRSVTVTPGDASLLALVVPVDPDAGTGAEAPRDVSVTLRNLEGVWVYLPYASG